jgi:hypothetical protein
MAGSEVALLLLLPHYRFLQQNGRYQAPEKLLVCDYYRNSQNLALASLSVIPWA